jgi:hypothetical protein
MAALATVLLATVLLAAAPAAAAQPEDEPGAARLEVDALDATVRPGGGLTLRGRVVNTGDRPLEDTRVVVTLQGRTTTRVDFQRAADGPPQRRSSVATETVELGDVGVGAEVPIELVRSAVELGLDDVDDRVAGVYPLRLQVVAGDEVAFQVTTGAVVLPELVGEPVRAALLVPFDSDVGLTGGPLSAGDPLAGGLGEDARLPDLAAALAEAPEVPLTVATSGLALEQALDASDGYPTRDAAGEVVLGPEAPQAQRAAALLADLGTVLRRPAVEQIALPYASADLVGLVRSGQPDAARDAVARGVLSSAERTPSRPVPGVLWPPDGLDDETLDTLSAGLGTVVLDPAYLDVAAVGGGELSPPPVQRLRTPDGSAVTVLVADPWLSPLLAGRPVPRPGEPADPTVDPALTATWPTEHGPALAAQRLLAETAALYFESPFTDRTRGVLLAPPQRWDPSPEALRALLQGLSTAPWLRPVTVPQLTTQVEASEDSVGLAYPDAARARELPSGYLAEVAQAREAVAGLAGLLAEDTDPVEPQRLVAVSTSVQYRAAPDEGRALLEAVDRVATMVFDGIEVLQGPAFTLTGSGGSLIPVEVRNNGVAPVEVAVHMAHNRFAIEPAEQVATVAPGEVVRVAFEVRALTPGVSGPIDATVTDTAGRRVLDTSLVVVRARTSSVAALALMVGAAAVLAVWWFRDARRRRASRTALSPI